MRKTGIRNLKDHLSQYIARAAAGERIVITDRGRPVAELTPPTKSTGFLARYDELVASGVIIPAVERGHPLPRQSKFKLPKGTAAKLIDADREERF